MQGSITFVLDITSNVDLSVWTLLLGAKLNVLKHRFGFS